MQIHRKKCLNAEKHCVDSIDQFGALNTRFTYHIDSWVIITGISTTYVMLCCLVLGHFHTC